ncbi:asparagine synthase-related protein [Novosphingobium subterraneum]|uniref:asparagine synthase-related protein n=1 Tax=Novosphingobium subterraneum TaxID=48936 RepID=UPI003D00B62B
MIGVPLLLAIPVDWTGRDGVETAARLSDVCSARPRLWIGSGVRSIPWGRGGKVIGPVFRRDLRESPKFGPDWRASGSVLELVEQLSRQCWGAYLAILPGRDGEGLGVFGDPSGLLPVYRTTSGGHVLLSSDPRLFAGAGAAAPAIDWAALRVHLGWPELRQEATCLAGVDELRPGMLYRFGGAGRPDETVWRPEDFLPTGPVPDFGDATAVLRACVQDVMGAWAENLGPVAVAASGGVDSSLICAALACGGHRFSCITLATADPSGDERRFVRTLADRLGAIVDERIYSPAAIDLTLSASRGLPRPARRSLSLALDEALDSARIRLGANTVFDGNGGDNLFCFLHSAAPVVDRLRAQGVRAALPTFLDMCSVTGADLQTMVGAVWRRYWRKGRRKDWPADRQLLAGTPDNWPMPTALTPWLEADVGIHGGKRDHLALILHAQNHIHGLGGIDVPRFSPLMSQPLLELCLALPTWLWCRGGINRSLARAAFADVLPQSVLRRTAKAGPDSFLRQLFAGNRKLLRAMLLDGHLARHGLVDRPAIEAAMATDVLSADAIAYRLLDLAEAEAWVRSWTG